LIVALFLLDLRVSIPVLITTNSVPWYWALPACFLGNMLPVPFLLIFLGPISDRLRRISVLASIMDWVFERTKTKGGIVEKYGPWGLVWLVLTPLPGTSTVTASFAAFLMGIPFRKAFPAIAVATLISAIVFTTLTVLGIEAWWLFFSPGSEG
jgi:uncharacterized membrane protein